MRYRVDLSYSGEGFCGWQIQPSAPSVQGAIQDALTMLLRTPVSLVGAGRTDTGVGALAYTAHFDAPAELDCAYLLRKLNALLPKGISIKALSPADPAFHARFDASRREYLYYLHRVKDPFASAHSYQYCYPQLDFDAMNRAARLLVGRHDFSCFEKTGGDNKTSVCTIFEAVWEQCPRGSVPTFGAAQDYWMFRISADRFLRNMVRAIVGTLLEVGRGKRSVESISELIASGTRSDAGESVPGPALFLSAVDYGAPLLQGNDNEQKDI